MIYPQKKENSLPSYLLMSLGLHIIVIALFSVLNPKFVQEQYTQITINIGGGQIARPPITPAKPIPTQSKPVLKEETKEMPVVKETVLPKAVSKEIVTPAVPVAPSPVKTPVLKKENPAPTPPKEVTPPAQNSPQAVTPPAPIQKTIEKQAPVPVVTEPKKVAKEESELASALDDILTKKTSTKAASDFLADAAWTGTPRKTIDFPNITSKIPPQYKNRGYGFSVTAKITFSAQGWVSGVELLHTSGDPRIDSIFRSELRKIRIEESSKNGFDTIIKTFTVSVK